MKVKTAQPSLSASELKAQLWDAFIKLKGNKIAVNEALATAGLGREIIRIISTQLKVSVHTGRPLAYEVVEFSES